MAIALHLSPEQEAKLRSVASELRVSPEALAESAARDFLAQSDDEFLRLARAIIEQNNELYERLR